MLGVKENLMTVLRGGCPDYVPGYTFASSGEGNPPNVMLTPPLSFPPQGDRKGRNRYLGCGVCSDHVHKRRFAAQAGAVYFKGHQKVAGCDKGA